MPAQLYSNAVVPAAVPDPGVSATCEGGKGGATAVALPPRRAFNVKPLEFTVQVWCA